MTSFYEKTTMLRQHNIMPPRCACGSTDVEHGYKFERHGYLQVCEVCGLEMFWSSDLITIQEVDAMLAAYRRERRTRAPREAKPRRSRRTRSEHKQCDQVVSNAG
jgi:hypothetical protein